MEDGKVKDALELAIEKSVEAREAVYATRRDTVRELVRAVSSSMRALSAEANRPWKVWSAAVEPEFARGGPLPLAAVVAELSAWPKTTEPAAPHVRRRTREVMDELAKASDALRDVLGRDESRPVVFCHSNGVARAEFATLYDMAAILAGASVRVVSHAGLAPARAVVMLLQDDER